MFLPAPPDQIHELVGKDVSTIPTRLTRVSFKNLSVEGPSRKRTDQVVNRGGDSRRRGWGVWWVVLL